MPSRALYVLRPEYRVLLVAEQGSTILEGFSALTSFVCSATRFVLMLGLKGRLLLVSVPSRALYVLRPNTAVVQDQPATNVSVPSRALYVLRREILVEGGLNLPSTEFQCPHELCMFCDRDNPLTGCPSRRSFGFQCPHELCMFCDSAFLPPRRPKRPEI